MERFETFLISSIAYRTAITDRRLFEVIKNKGASNVKLQSKNQIRNVRYKTHANESRGTSPKRDQNVFRQQKKIWEPIKEYSDTSALYRRNRCHMGLWSRIASNSKGSLPREINFLTSEEIRSADRDAIASYTTPSRSIRKCCLTVFTACAKMASRSLGCIKDSKKHPYSCKPISLSVKELSKSTHAGTDTLGRKNDPKVQERVIKQIRDLLRKPTSYKLYKGVTFSIPFALYNMYNMPELIFHRFQATYDDVLNKCVEKSRIVWCVPYLIVALENMFFGKLIEMSKQHALISNTSIFPIGLTNYEIGQKSVGTLRQTFNIIGTDNGYKIYSLDFSKFDTNIPNWTKDLFFALFRSTLILNDAEEKVYDYLRTYIKYTPFISQDKILYKERGISSGLLITNLFDTWWNLTIHFFVKVLQEIYSESVNDIYLEKCDFSTLYLDKERVKYEFLMSEPHVRVMGDDAIILCDEFTLNLHRVVCKMLGMVVKVKHVCEHPDDDIFFLGRYWNKTNRPFQTESYMALRIVYTRWYDERILPFKLDNLHLFRMLSICLPLIGGKEFLDKYLFDYKPYVEFKNSTKGFTYMKDFIEDQFKFIDRDDAFSVDTY